jgi:capsular polysaccharide biosynthesis protein
MQTESTRTAVYAPTAVAVAPALPPLRWTWRRIVAAATIVLACAGGGAAIAAARTQVYESSSAVLLQQPELQRTAGVGVFVKLNQLRLHYTALVDTDAVTRPVANSLSLSRARVADAVSVDAPSESLLLYPKARADTAQLAQRIARATTNELVSYAESEQSAAHIPAKDRVTLSVVDAASKGKKVAPTSANVSASAAFGAIVGVILIAALVQVPAARRRLT